MWQVPLFDLDFDEREYSAVREVLESKWLASGPRVKKFEEEFSAYLGGDVFCCAVTNCTAALHMALLMNNVTKRDEVIISGLSFVAALNMIMMIGARPVLADSKSLIDWNVSPDDIHKKITRRTKAIIIVHFAGYPCDMDEIKTIARENNIVLIEDVAHAIGADYKGSKCGTFGDISCFSFFSNKNLSTGEGGMLVSRFLDDDAKARLLRSHGMTSMTIERHSGKIISYDVISSGLNYRMDEIRAALGIVQLSKLEENNTKRKKIAEKYRSELDSLKGLVIPWKNEDENKKSSYHIFPILLPPDVNRERVVKFLIDRGIQTSIHYPAYSQFSYYKNKISEDIKIATEISNRVLTLPLYPNMSHEDLLFVCNNLKEALWKK